MQSGKEIEDKKDNSISEPDNNVFNSEAIAILTAKGLPRDDVHSYMLQACIFILNLCDNESHGIVDDILGIKTKFPTSLSGTFDKTTSLIKWHANSSEDLANKIILQIIINEKEICTKLAESYDNYPKKLSYLVTLYTAIMDCYKQSYLKIKAERPNTPTIYIPEIPDDLEISCRKARHVAIYQATQVEPCSLEWKEAQAEQQLKPKNNLTNNLTDKYFNYHYFARSNLRDLEITWAFFQELLFYISGLYIPISSVEDFDEAYLKQQKTVHVVCALDLYSKSVTVTLGNIETQKKDYANIIKKMVSLRNLNQVLSPAAIEAHSDKKAYFKNLCVEILTCIKWRMVEIENDHDATNNQSIEISNEPATKIELATAAMEKVIEDAQEISIYLGDNLLKLFITRKFLKTLNVDDNDFVKALCAFQAALDAGKSGVILNTHYLKRKAVIQKRWKKHLCVQPKALLDINTAKVKVEFEYDEKNQKQCAEVAKLKTLINLDDINQYINAPTLLDIEPPKNDYAFRLFEDIEVFLIAELQKSPYKHVSPLLDKIYISDFAKTKLKHIAMEELAARCSRFADINELYDDLLIGINKFMEYCDRISNNLLRNITGIDYKLNNYFISQLNPREDTPINDLREEAKFYFDIDKFESEFNDKKTFNAKLEFLASEFTNAYLIEKRLAKAVPNRMITTTVNIPNQNPRRIIQSPSFFNVDPNKTKLKLREAIKKIESTVDSSKVTKAQKKKAGEKNDTSDQKAQSDDKQQQADEMKMRNAEDKQDNDSSTAVDSTLAGLFFNLDGAKILNARGINRDELCRIMLKACVFLLNLCDYESRGILSDIVGFKTFSPATLFGTFDKSSSRILWHVSTREDLIDKDLLQIIIDESAIENHLSNASFSYQDKILYLLKIFSAIYRCYNQALNKLKTFYPEEIIPTLPELPNDEDLNSRMQIYVTLYNVTNTEPSTPDWKLAHDRLNAKSETILDESDEFLKSEFAGKFYNLPYFPGSELNELLIATVFLQETIFFIGSIYNVKNFEKENVVTYPKFWKLTISIACTIDPDSKRLVFKFKGNQAQKLRASAIINKIVNLESLNKLLSHSVISTVANKEIYFKSLVDEVLGCLNFLKIDDEIKRTSNTHLERILSCDFAFEYANQATLINAANAVANDPAGKELFYKKVSIEASGLMGFAEMLSGGKIAEISQFKLHPSLKIPQPKSPQEMNVSCINGYFDFRKLNAKFKSLAADKIALTHFFTNVYISAGMIINRINFPNEYFPNPINYRLLRASLYQYSTTDNHPSTVNSLIVMDRLVEDARKEISPIVIDDAKITEILAEKVMKQNDFNHNDFIKALCFIQSVLNLATHINILDTTYRSRKQIIQRRWKKYFSIQPKIITDAFTGRKRVDFELDEKNEQQIAEVSQLKTIINFDLINNYINVASTTLPADQNFVHMFFEEIESYLVSELQKIPHRNCCALLNSAYISDFAKTSLRHTPLEELATNCYGNRGEDIDSSDLFQGLNASIHAFMEYCDRLSMTLLPTVTLIKYNKNDKYNIVDIRDQADIYIDVDNFEIELAEKDSYKTKLQFLAAQYTEAYIIYKSIIKTMYKGGYIAGQIIKIDNARTALAINNLIEQQEKTHSETKVVSISKKKRDKQTAVTPATATSFDDDDDDKKAPPQTPASSSESNTLTAPTPLQIYKKDFDATKAQLKFLSFKIQSIREESSALGKQLKQTHKYDNEARIHNLRPHRVTVNNLENQVYTNAELVKQMEKTLKDIKPEEETKLADNTTLLNDVKKEITSFELTYETILANIREESLLLDGIVTKKTLNKAEELFQESQRFKVRRARELAEEKVSTAKKDKEKTARPRSIPSSKPKQTLGLALKTALAPAKKTEHKTEYKTVKSNPDNKLRLLHLDEACKNLILIHKILEFYTSELSAEEIHYALLYNIFRCFQSLKMYQEKGGQQRSINPDEVANLRNMIMHHGAGSAHPEAVLAFAKEMQAKLPQHLLKLTHRSLSGYELQKTQRQELMAEFNLLEPSLRFSGFLDHSKLVLDDTPLYKKLAEFHEQKIDNNDNANICEQVFGIYIPLIRSMMPPLVKATSHESEMKPEHLLETFGFQLQALRLLISICGEFEPHITPLTKDKSVISFLKFCRQDIRNPMGHNVIDSLEPEIFINTLKRYLASIDEKSQLTKLKKCISTAPLTTSPTLFGSRGAGSALDMKYDKPLAQQSFKPKKIG